MPAGKLGAVFTEQPLNMMGKKKIEAEKSPVITNQKMPSLYHVWGPYPVLTVGFLEGQFKRTQNSGVLLQVIEGRAICVLETFWWQLVPEKGKSTLLDLFQKLPLGNMMVSFITHFLFC